MNQGDCIIISFSFETKKTKRSTSSFCTNTHVYIQNAMSDFLDKLLTENSQKIKSFTSKSLFDYYIDNFFRDHQQMQQHIEILRNCREITVDHFRFENMQFLLEEFDKIIIIFWVSRKLS